jgi:hypothetical protein
MVSASRRRYSKRLLAQILERAPPQWPSSSLPVHTGDPRTVSAPIDNDTLADCCIMFAIISRTQPARIAEFFRLTGRRHQKIAFLIKHSHFEDWRKTS